MSFQGTGGTGSVDLNPSYYTPVYPSNNILIEFNAPIDPGGTAYFTVANPAIATPCSSAVNKSVSTSVLSNGTEMSAIFTPSSGVTTQEAASLCGFKTFNWQQTVTYDPVNVARSNTPSINPLIAPYSDPPPGGYTYDKSPIGDSYPYYYSLLVNPLNLNDSRSLSNYISSNRLLFSDQPYYSGFKSEQYFGFTTQLVGVLPNDKLQPLGISFSWTSNYTGTSGGITPPTAQGLSLSLDSGNGTGGVTITGSNDITNYDYTAGFTIESINGIPNGSTLFANEVPEPSELPASIISASMFLIFLIRKYRQNLSDIFK